MELPHTPKLLLIPIHCQCPAYWPIRESEPPTNTPQLASQRLRGYRVKSGASSLPGGFAGCGSRQGVLPLSPSACVIAVLGIPSSVHRLHHSQQPQASVLAIHVLHGRVSKFVRTPLARLSPVELGMGDDEWSCSGVCRVCSTSHAQGTRGHVGGTEANGSERWVGGQSRGCLVSKVFNTSSCLQAGEANEPNPTAFRDDDS